MGIWLILVFIMVGTFVLCYFASDWWDAIGLEVASGITGVILAIVVVIMGVIMLCEHINPEAKYESMMAEREALVYCLDNELYINDNNVNAYEIITKVGDYNKEIVHARKARQNWWTKAFYGDYYEDVELIDLSQYDSNGGTVE